jgi:hypothetical protein
MNPDNSLNTEQAWCASASVRTDAERILRYRKQADQYRKCAAQEPMPLARKCLVDMARHLEQLASHLETSARGSAVVQRARIKVH